MAQIDFAEAVQGKADVRVMRVTLPPDVAAGWYTHPGPATVVVVSGELVDYSAAGCRDEWKRLVGPTWAVRFH